MKEEILDISSGVCRPVFRRGPAAASPDPDPLILGVFIFYLVFH